jgi:hypothetical protein
VDHTRKLKPCFTQTLDQEIGVGVLGLSGEAFRIEKMSFENQDFIRPGKESHWRWRDIYGALLSN